MSQRLFDPTPGEILDKLVDAFGPNWLTAITPTIHATGHHVVETSRVKLLRVQQAVNLDTLMAFPNAEQFERYVRERLAGAAADELLRTVSMGGRDENGMRLYTVSVGVILPKAQAEKEAQS